MKCIRSEGFQGCFEQVRQRAGRRASAGAAQVCGLSGIVALFFTGICHAHYSYYNVTPDAQARTRGSVI